MVFQIFKSPSITHKLPVINEPGYRGKQNYSNAQYIADRIVREIKNTPELVGIMDSLVTDHFLGPVDFYAKDGLKALGPTQYAKAKRFWSENNIRRIFQGAGMDYFMGDAYFWHPSIKSSSPSQFKETLETLPARFKQIVDEEGSTPRKIDYIPASTMTIQYDEFQVIGYKQMSQGLEIEYNTDEITHIKFIEFNGEVNGMSGLKALAKEVAMMYLLKENILAQLENGGSPDSIIYLKNGIQASRSRFERLQLALESFSHIKNAHGNLAIDGDVGVHQLGVGLKDMEYRELAMFIISEFAIATGLPTSNIPLLMSGQGGVANKGNLSGDANQGYERKINSRRLQWEDIVNEHIFNKLGFSIRFRRENLQDEVRETQATQMRYSSVGELQRVLQQQQKKLTDTALLDLLSGHQRVIQLNDIEDILESDLQSLNQNNPMNGKTPVTNPNNNVQRANSEARKPNATNRGTTV
jgi:hypothetical protein